MASLHRVKKGPAWAVVAVAVAAAVLVAASVGAAARTASAACKQQGELTYGISGAGITALDPATLAFSGQLPLQTLLYNSLTEYAPDGSVVPDLATKWRHSDDLKTWWFNLRRGVKYAD